MKFAAAIALSAVSCLAVLAWSQVRLEVAEVAVVVVAPAPAKQPVHKAEAPAPKPEPASPAPAELAPVAEKAAAPPPLARIQPARAAKAPAPRPRPAASAPPAAEEPAPAPPAAPEPMAEEPKAKGGAKAAAGDTGKLSLDTVPATEVYLGQNKIGDTPLVEVPLPAGHHALQVINDEKGISQSVEVDTRAGQTTKKRIQL
jgi:hypothetical protein